MEKRTKLILLIIGALILLLIGLWILFQPFLPKLLPAQPPGLPGAVSPGGAPPVQTPLTGKPTTIPQDIKQLEDLAAAIVSRVGSGSSANGFQGYDDVLINATPVFRETLRSRQQEMQRAHPANGPAYGIVTRVVSIDSRAAVSGADIIPFTVQAQQAEDAGNPAQPTRVSYTEVTVTFEKQSDGTYLLDNLEWKDIQL
ncbi:hypothetical protein HY479_04185 [Candidatus Uhrbacteria bacterium]|nr:hypothetical protein [Candidatus Uhrbacteria bacterium]